MSQMNQKEVFHNTAYSVQLPYTAGHSLYIKIKGTVSVISSDPSYKNDKDSQRHN